MSTKSVSRVAIHWFRKGLRLHDNPALLEACRGAKRVYPIFILDPHFAKPENVGRVRYSFLLESLQDLDRSLQARFDSRLFVIKGKPTEVLPGLFKKWNVDLITWEEDTEPYARKRDEAVFKMAKASGVQVEARVSHTLYDMSAISNLARGAPVTAYGSFCKLLQRLPEPANPLKEPAKGDIPTEISDYDAKAHSVPSLEDMGYEGGETGCPFPGGETRGLERMKDNLKRKRWVLSFEKPRTSPNTLEPSTTVLSPYLKFGCLSSRLFYRELRSIYAEAKGAHTKPPVSLEGQLFWREFYYYNSVATPNYDKMVGNPICRQIPWRSDPEHLAAWTEGRTGYPFVDACMTQLRTQGWIHHLARHMVACFLTRGDLWISWEEGARVFDRLLVDADWALNNGNWMWLSASCFFYQYFRVYSPVAFGRKTDKEGKYIRKWVPALRKFPKKYIYEPWKAPLAVQEACGCIIGKDYPAPIVEHSQVKGENMARMKAAYNAHRAGKSKGAKRPAGDTKTTRRKKAGKRVKSAR